MIFSALKRYFFILCIGITLVAVTSQIYSSSISTNFSIYNTEIRDVLSTQDTSDEKNTNIKNLKIAENILKKREKVFPSDGNKTILTNEN